MKDAIIAIVSKITKLDKEYLLASGSKPKLWDSLKNVEIILAVEDKWDIVFEPDELSTIDCLDKLISITESKVL